VCASSVLRTIPKIIILALQKREVPLFVFVVLKNCNLFNQDCTWGGGTSIDKYLCSITQLFLMIRIGYSIHTISATTGPKHVFSVR
jgi:hypothetical protein